MRPGRLWGGRDRAAICDRGIGGFSEGLGCGGYGVDLPDRADQHRRTDEKIARLAVVSSIMSHATGVTGLRTDISSTWRKILSRFGLKSICRGSGFGVSNPEQALHIAAHADGVVMGSAIVKLIEETTQCTNAQWQKSYNQSSPHSIRMRKKSNFFPGTVEYPNRKWSQTFPFDRVKV
jgi:hypothetical protein